MRPEPEADPESLTLPSCSRTNTGTLPGGLSLRPPARSKQMSRKGDCYDIAVMENFFFGHLEED